LEITVLYLIAVKMGYRLTQDMNLLEKLPVGMILFLLIIITKKAC